MENTGARTRSGEWSGPEWTATELPPERHDPQTREHKPGEPELPVEFRLPADNELQDR